MQLLKHSCVMYTHDMCECNAFSFTFYSCSGAKPVLRILASSEVGVFCEHMFLSIQIYYAEPRLHSGMSGWSCCKAVISTPLVLNGSCNFVTCKSDQIPLCVEWNRTVGWKGVMLGTTHSRSQILI